jgi:hypothetical protein
MSEREEKTVKVKANDDWSLEIAPSKHGSGDLALEVTVSRGQTPIVVMHMSRKAFLHLAGAVLTDEQIAELNRLRGAEPQMPPEYSAR